MNRKAINVTVLSGLLIRSVVVDANIQTGNELIDTHQSFFPGTEVISIEHCPVEEMTSTIMHCEALDANGAGHSLLPIQEVEGYPVQFDIYQTSSDTVYL